MKKIYGMIHLAGANPVSQAIAEIHLYKEHGVNAAIVENYHGSIQDVIETMKGAQNLGMELGVNILPNEFDKAFTIASQLGGEFIQLDHVAGSYDYGTLDLKRFKHYKSKFSSIQVLGGVWPKYYTPQTNSNLEDDLNQAKTRCNSVVVTGQGTGMQTLIEKVQAFKRILGDFPLIVGAGVTIDNVADQLSLADGAIVGSFFKEDNQTNKPIDKNKLRDFMQAVRSIE